MSETLELFSRTDTTWSVQLRTNTSGFHLLYKHLAVASAVASFTVYMVRQAATVNAAVE